MHRQIRRPLPLFLSVALLLALCVPPAIPEDRPEEIGLVEKVEVTAARLPGGEETSDIPANVTVIDHAAIERSGAATLQDLIAFESGVVLYDQVGNDLEKTVDLRGFSSGSGTRIFLDGAPLNDIRNNSLVLHLVPLDVIQQVEIVRGSAANSAGGGAEAGIINLRTIRSDRLGGEVSASFGSDSTSRYSAHIRDGAGRMNYVLSGKIEETDGFRQNSGGDLNRLYGSIGIDLAEDHHVELAVLDSDSGLGNPGALTEDEYREDRWTSPFNYLDFADEDLRQAALNYRGDLNGSSSLSVNLFHRKRESQILSTGRSAPTFGGFLLESDGSVTGSTVQLNGTAGPNRWTAGAEWLDGSIDSAGFSTLAVDPGTIDTSVPPSTNTADRRTIGFYLRNSFDAGEELSIHTGMRYDRDRAGYIDTGSTVPDADSKTFSELTFRIGANWRSFYFSLGESFLPPTVEQMFAYPLFGSNRELDPQESTTYEAGYRATIYGTHSLNFTLLQVDTDREIIYVPGSPPDWIGRNENALSTRRRGIEANYKGGITARLEVFANLSYYDAEYSEGSNTGNRIPLVPEERLAVGINLDLPAGIGCGLEALYVGDQVLDNDGGNTQGLLGSYTVANARLWWGLGTDGPRLFVEARNLFDEEYVSRGIYAYDFRSYDYAVFLTPAPGRRVYGGLAWRF